MEIADESARIALESWYDAPSSEAKVLEVTHLFQSLGIRELAEQEMKSLLAKAFEALEEIENADPEAKSDLKSFAQYLVSREE